MAIRSGGKGAYAPPANVLDTIEAYRSRGLTTPFNIEVLVRAGVPESVAPRVMSSLEVLELVDRHGNPTDQLDALRLAPKAEFQARLREFVEGAYAEILQYVDPATDDAEKALDAFRGVEPRGQMRRMVTMFHGLADAAGMIPEGAPAKPGAKRTARAKSRAKKASGAERPSRPASVSARKARLRNEEGGLIPAPISGLLASLPAEDKGWTKTQRERFMETFATVLDFVIPIHDDVNPPKEQTDDE